MRLKSRTILTVVICAIVAAVVALPFLLPSPHHRAFDKAQAAVQAYLKEFPPSPLDHDVQNGAVRDRLLKSKLSRWWGRDGARVKTLSDRVSNWWSSNQGRAAFPLTDIECEQFLHETQWVAEDVRSILAMPIFKPDTKAFDVVAASYLSACIRVRLMCSVQLGHKDMVIAEMKESLALAARQTQNASTVIGAIVVYHFERLVMEVVVGYMVEHGCISTATCDELIALKPHRNLEMRRLLQGEIDFGCAEIAHGNVETLLAKLPKSRKPSFWKRLENFYRDRHDTDPVLEELRVVPAVVENTAAILRSDWDGKVNLLDQASIAAAFDRLAPLDLALDSVVTGGIYKTVLRRNICTAVAGAEALWLALELKVRGLGDRSDWSDASVRADLEHIAKRYPHLSLIWREGEVEIDCFTHWGTRVDRGAITPIVLPLKPLAMK